MGPWARPFASLLSQSVNDSELDSAGRHRTAGSIRKGMKQDSEARRTLQLSGAALENTQEWGGKQGGSARRHWAPGRSPGQGSRCNDPHLRGWGPTRKPAHTRRRARPELRFNPSRPQLAA